MEAVKSQNAPDSQLHFLDYWRIIRIRKTVILAVFLLVFITTTVVTFILPQSFMSMARIAVEKDGSDIAGLFERQNVNSYDPYFIQTEFEKIQSQRVLYEVIADLNLNEKWGKRYNSGVPLKTNETFLLLKRQLEVRQFRNTSLIEIRVYSEDKFEAAEIANKVAETYKAWRISSREEGTARGIEKLQQKYAEQEMTVTNMAQELYRLREELKISDAIAEGAGPVSTLEPETLRRMEMERIQAETQYGIWSARLADLERLKPEELRRAILTINYDQPLATLMQDLSTAEQKFIVLKQDVTEENPEYEKLVALVAKINLQIEERVQGIMQGFISQVQTYRDTAQKLALAVGKAREDDIKSTVRYRPYFKLKRDLETESQVLQTMKFKLVQEEVNLSLPRQSIVEVTDAAEPGLRPVRPNVPLNITLGVIVGLIVGIGLAFFIEYLDTSVKTIDDVERALQAPVLGVIPQNVGFLIHEGPDSPHAEAYRVLRTNVLFSRKDPTRNSLTVVSGGAGEGKSTTIFNLATVFAQNGQRVLLVDSDLRRPSLHKILTLTNSIGLTNFLLRQNSLEEVIQVTKEPNLDFLPSGKLPSSSMGILNSQPMKDFIKEVKQRYDFVFFDSPPIMGVSDASILASEVDMALLIVQYRKYPQAMTVRAKQMVEKVGGHCLGVVLNNINISQDSYYYYYSGYYYDYYSKHEDEGPDAKKNGDQPTETPGKRASIDIKQKY
jgi:capsular exopolysaccharide synthesis family protein